MILQHKDILLKQDHISMVSNDILYLASSTDFISIFRHVAQQDVVKYGKNPRSVKVKLLVCMKYQSK